MSNEINEEIIQNTQKILGKYVKKPPLTEKLLRKPPFRFLHDIVITVIRETGFLKGLYNERELVSENVKNKDDKISFLNKLVDATKAITGMDLAVRTSKVIAGLEPTATNLLLQAIGIALDKNLNSTQYVTQIQKGKKVKSTVSTQEDDKKKRNVKNKGKDSLTPKDQRESKIKGISTTPRIKNTPKEKSSKPTIKAKSNRSISKDLMDKNIKEKPKRNKEDISLTGENGISIKNTEENVKNVTETNTDIINSKQPDVLLHIISNSTESTPEVQTEEVKANILEMKPLKPDDIEDVAQNVINNNTTNLEISCKEETIDNILIKRERVKSAKFQNVNLKPTNDTSNLTISSNESTDTNASAQLTNLLRPPSVRPSSARPGAPRLRIDTTLLEGEVVPLGKVNVILENYVNKDIDEEETVTIQSLAEPEFQPPILQLPTDKGHLVEQILEQIHHDNVIEHVKPTVNIEWEKNGLRGRNAINKEVDQLKSAIQTLTRTVNPLGKLVNYLHEDIDAMHSELDMWITLTRQATAEIVGHKRITDESNKPLFLKLQEIEGNISKLQQEIMSVHGNILHNESRIQDLLMK